MKGPAASNEAAKRDAEKRKEEVMEHVLKYVRGKYGSIDSYLDGIGFDGEKRRRLAAALCE